MRLPRAVLIVLAAMMAGSALAAPKWDANGDGKMDKSEFTTIATETLINRADKNADGRISLEEWKARPAAAKAKGNIDRRFTRLDKNGDGSLDAAELTPLLERQFARLDRDRDGALSNEERQARPAAAEDE